MSKGLILGLGDVCMDVIASACRHMEEERLFNKWPKGNTRILDIVREYTAKQSYLWWDHCPPTTLFTTLGAELPKFFEQITIASKVQTYEEIAGKAVWISKNTHNIPFLPVLHGLKADHFLHSSVLIDDDEEEIAAWTGPKILVPRRWNSGDEADINEAIMAGLRRHAG